MSKDNKKINRYLDNYYVDQDTPQTVGEIFLKQPDADLNPKDVPMAKQSRKLYSAIEKIYGGYLGAASKEAYKKQFDIYPLRDFDAYMNTLGAIRAPGGKDFIGTGPETDWYKVIAAERKTRTEIYDNAVNNTKVDEKITKDRTELGTEIVNKVKNNSLEAAKLANKIFYDFGLQSIPVEELTTRFEKNPGSFIDFYENQIKNNVQISQQNKEKAERYFQDYTKKMNIGTSDVSKKQETDAVQKKHDELEKSIKEQKEKTNLTEDESEKVKKDEKTLKELDNKIKNNKVKREQVLGQIIKEEEQKIVTQNMNIWENNILEVDKSGKVHNPYDGFTTKGPFCLEKQNYFRNVFRKSMSHYDTEFREAEYTTYPGQDEGNDITQINQSIIGSPLKKQENKNNNDDPKSVDGLSPTWMSSDAKNLVKNVNIGLDQKSFDKFVQEFQSFVSYTDFGQILGIDYSDKKPWKSFLKSYVDILIGLGFSVTNSKATSVRDKENWNIWKDRSVQLAVMSIEFLAKTIIFCDLTGKNNLKQSIWGLGSSSTFISKTYNTSSNLENDLKINRSYLIEKFNLSIT